MPANRLALIRYKTIDNCLSNRYRRWTLEDLVEACSDALYEYEGKSQGVSQRTVQLDIQNMRSEKLGYNAPIMVVDKKYYTYEDPGYSITNMPLSSSDVRELKQIAYTLKQFEGFKQFADMEEALKEIENKVFAISNNSRTIIDFEKNNNLKGISFLNEIYNAIREKQALKINYKPFRSKNELLIRLSPYLLKEYRNRWFVFGKNKYRLQVMPLALDRIRKIRPDNQNPFEENVSFNLESYFENIVGVTLYENKPVERVVFEILNEHAPYVETKPFHHSQKTLERLVSSTIFSIDVIPNPELEREFLGYGEYLKVLEPEWLRARFSDRVTEMKKFYDFLP